MPAREPSRARAAAVQSGFEFAEGTNPGLSGSSYEALKLAEHLRASILAHTPDAKVPEKLDGWAKDIELAIRLDKRDPDALRSAIDYAHCDPSGSFWRANLRSGEKLRKHFETLRDQRSRSAASATPARRDAEVPNLTWAHLDRERAS